MKARELLEVISEAQQSEGFNRIASVEELVADRLQRSAMMKDDQKKMYNAVFKTLKSKSVFDDDATKMAKEAVDLYFKLRSKQDKHDPNRLRDAVEDELIKMWKQK